jgi:hypothetical protein
MNDLVIDELIARIRSRRLRPHTAEECVLAVREAVIADGQQISLETFEAYAGALIAQLAGGVSRGFMRLKAPNYSIVPKHSTAEAAAKALDISPVGRVKR